MKIEKFEDIVAWKKAEELTIKIYTEFSKSKDFSFRDQICRASVSIMNNIAEGFERNTDKEFKFFLFIAKGSSGEVRSMLHLAKSLKYIDEVKCRDLALLCSEISRIIAGLIKTL